jgi:peptidoglycan/xylan/chitin deacetylase (PgdA/CDA1 family)
MGLDEELAVAYINTLADAVERVGGVLTLNWHPDLTLPEERWNTFVRVVKALDDRGAWFATTSQLGDYWREHHGDLYK